MTATSTRPSKQRRRPWLVGTALLIALSAAAAFGVACEVQQAHITTDIEGGDCVVCHRDDYESAAEPLHVQQIPLSCNTCHEYQAWSPALGSNHASFFDLRFTHAEAGCGACHQSGFEPGVTPTQCVGCHQDDRDRVVHPSHDGLPEQCGGCHDERAFSPSTFQHSWPLLGEHAATACSNCHVGEPTVYGGTPSTCIDCHRNDYDMATQPPHVDFSTDCASCHSPLGWHGGGSGDPSFTHPWPLRGAHATAACSGCHVGSPAVYAGTPTACVDCHADERDRAEPSHDNFSTQCESCHSEASFTPAALDHSWPITGAHTAVDCTGCHTGDPPVYADTPVECVGCHRDDYASSPFPGHSTFSTDCASCHSTAGWRPASGAHAEDQFPTTGRHDYPCMDCHDAELGPNSRDNTDCVGCHDEGRHSRARTDPQHEGVRGYPSGEAAPNFCLDCHPDGNE